MCETRQNPAAPVTNTTMPPGCKGNAEEEERAQALGPCGLPARFCRIQGLSLTRLHG